MCGNNTMCYGILQTTSQLPVYTQQPTFYINQLNRTKSRLEAKAAANNIEREDFLMQETVAGRHYQQNTNHAAVQRQKHRMHISAGCSTDFQACADTDQVDYHHHFYFFTQTLFMSGFHLFSSNFCHR
jgi:hypothetical protein